MEKVNKDLKDTITLKSKLQEELAEKPINEREYTRIT